jgi:hypothetical protein
LTVPLREGWHDAIAFRRNRQPQRRRLLPPPGCFEARRPANSLLAAFYFPLGFGTAGIALAIAAAITKGRSPWWAAVAVIGSLAALGLGIDAYSQFQDASDALNDLNSLNF